MQHHPIGTEIYYAGDMASPSGCGKITQLTPNARFGATYDIELEGGCLLLGIPTMLVSDRYEGHRSPRFVTKAAYDAYWKERSNPQTPAFFHGIEHLTIDDAGYVSWKGKHVERFDPEFAYTDAAKGKARILAARCRHLEAIGKDVNKFNLTKNVHCQSRRKKPDGTHRGQNSEALQTLSAEESLVIARCSKLTSSTSPETLYGTISPMSKNGGTIYGRRGSRARLRGNHDRHLQGLRRDLTARSSIGSRVSYLPCAGRQALQAPIEVPLRASPLA